MKDAKSNSTDQLRNAPDHLHRVQSLWQIWLPLGMIAVLIIGFFCITVLITQSGAMNLGQVQNAAVILMILPLAIIGALTLIGILLAIFGTSRLFPLIPRLRIFSQQINSLSSSITTWSNRVMLPFVLVRGFRNRFSLKKKKLLSE